MKVLTLIQSRATSVALGAKRYETRSWSTAYCGPFGIHAGRGENNTAGLRYCRNVHFTGELALHAFALQCNTMDCASYVQATRPRK